MRLYACDVSVKFYWRWLGGFLCVEENVAIFRVFWGSKMAKKVPFSALKRE